MTETTASTTEPSSGSGTTAKAKRGGGLSSMLLADLKQLAGSLGVTGSGSMKKAQLVEAIKSARAGGESPAAPAKQPAAEPAQRAPRVEAPAAAEAAPRRRERERPAASSTGGEQARNENRDEQKKDEQKKDERARAEQAKAEQRAAQSRRDKAAHQAQEAGQAKQDGKQDQKQDNKQDGKLGQKQGGQQGGQQNGQQGNQVKPDQNGQQNNQSNQNNQSSQQQDDDEDGGSRRNRRRRGRDRVRPGVTGQRNEPDTTILEDDVLVPAAGILDVLDNYAFVRTSGYLPGDDDVYLSLSMVRKFALRRGDAVVGQVRQPREGERKEKFNPMVRIDSVNGAEPDHATVRADFETLTAQHPSERLRLEIETGDVVGRSLDLLAPIGKGQRALVIAPPRSGKTALLQSIARSVTTNNPECHLMVVLVDERPEEVTDFEKAIKGEVVSSPFDRTPADHTAVAELALERAKRLVELGHDVVVLFDGLTRLGRAYNLISTTSGRALPGGVDPSSLHPPKRFFGAARNVDNGGSLTIIATVAVETGSVTDEVFFEHLRDTANAEIRLRSDLAERRLAPALDVAGTRTRRDELLTSEQESAIVLSLRDELLALDPATAVESLLRRVARTRSNIELLMQVQRSATGESA